MTRVNVYALTRVNPDRETLEAGPVLLGWFDYGKAERWSDEDINHNGSGGTGRGEAVLRTAQGRWVLQHWTSWQGEDPQYEYISDERARDWLLRNEEDAAVAKYFGPVPEEEDRRPGRPAIGEPVNVRFGEELLGMVDQYAAQRSISRAEAIRRLIQDAVTRAQVATAAPLSAQDNR